MIYFYLLSVPGLVQSGIISLKHIFLKCSRGNFLIILVSETQRFRVIQPSFDLSECYFYTGLFVSLKANVCCVSSLFVFMQTEERSPA